MITLSQKKDAVRKTFAYFSKAGIVLSFREKKSIEVADFGLSDLKTTGLQLVTYVNTMRCCPKELVLFPAQTCPEHLHPSVGGAKGKEETFRFRLGMIYFYFPGNRAGRLKTNPPHTPSDH